MSAARIARKWWRAWVGVCLIITGAPALVACYGPPVIPPEPHDPSVELTDFSYEPASPVRLGDALVFQLSTSKPTTAGDVFVFIGEWDPGSSVAPPYWNQVHLNDWGVELDEAAADGIWTGALEWRADYGMQDNLPVIARLIWDDGNPPLVLSGLPLTVVAPGEE